MSGRAWRSVAAQLREDGRRHQACTAFDALFGEEKDDEEQESEEEDSDSDSSDETSSEEASGDDSQDGSGNGVKPATSVTGSQKSKEEVNAWTMDAVHPTSLV